MTSTPNQRSIHIDAPVQKVFDHVKDPNNFVMADPEPVHLSNLSLLPWANKVLKRPFSSQGRQLERMLPNYREAIQA